MKSLYRESKWAELQLLKEDGVLKEYNYIGRYGKVTYRFFQKYAGTINGIDYFDISTFRGAEGPYIEAEDDNDEIITELLITFSAEFEQYCNSQNIIAEFAKLDPWDKYSSKIRQFFNATFYGNYYCNDLTIDFYNENYNRRSKRAIKKAEENGVIVQVDYVGKTIKDFIRLYENTEEKYNTSDYYRFNESDIKRYFEILKDKVFLANAIYEDKIITSVLVAMGVDIMHYLYLGNDPEYLALQGNSLLTYKTACMGKNLNKKIFDMGGGVAGGSIEKFKKNFISDSGIYPYYAIRKIRNNEVYNKLVLKKQDIQNKNFFPLYRG